MLEEFSLPTQDRVAHLTGDLMLHDGARQVHWGITDGPRRLVCGARWLHG